MDTLREYWESESLTRPQSKLEGVIKYQFQNFGKGAALFIGPIKLQIVNLSVIRLQWNGFVSYQTSMDSLSGVSFIV